MKHHDLSYARLHVKSATYQPPQLNMNERGAIAITLLFLFTLISALLYFARREVVLFASRVFGNSPSTDEESQAEQAVNKEGQERSQSGGEKKAEANPSCRFPEHGRSRCTKLQHAVRCRSAHWTRLPVSGPLAAETTVQWS